MMITNSDKSTVWLLLALLVPVSVFADALTDRQYSASEAQKAYDLEKTRYDDATVLVNEQKQRVQESQALLKERQSQQAAAKSRMLKAKAQLDSENRQLQKAWGKRSH